MSRGSERIRGGTVPHLELIRGGRPEPAPATHPHHPPQTVAVASGKGGVGKTSLTVNLALALAGLGERVLVVDGDFGLGKVDILLGVEPRLDLGDFFRGDVSLREIMTVGPRGVSVLPGGCGEGDLVELGPSRREQLRQAIVEMTRGFDRILIDLATGIGSTPMGLAARADEVLLLTTPEPTAITDAYAVTKILARRGGTPPRIVVNRVRTPVEAGETYARLARTASQHLGLTLADWGFIPEDRAVTEAVAAQIPFVLRAPSSPSSRRVIDLARRLAAGRDPDRGDRRPVRSGTIPLSPLAA